MINKFILWIDDIQNWAGITAANLHIIAEQNGINLIVMPQLNGENLDQILMMYPFDVIVMDFQMEPFNGDKYIRDIREHLHLDTCPILFYTQNPDVDLHAKVPNLVNVHITNRRGLEDMIKSYLMPGL